MRFLGVAAALVLLTGCDEHPQPRAAPSQPDAPKMASKAPVAQQPATKVIVDADGVVFDPPGGKLAEVNFGGGREELQVAATRLLGPPEESSNDECGAGPMKFARYGPLTLNFLDGKFVGWTAGEGAGVVTSDGITVGKRLRDLKIARSVRMPASSTLEGEFDYLAADGHPIGGFAAGKDRDAKIASLYAGVTCFFR